MTKYVYLNVVVLLYYICYIVQSAKILGIYHVPNKSHFKIGSSILHGLAAKGHEVTIASPYSTELNNPNIKNIFVDGILDIANANHKSWSSFHDSGIIAFFEKYRKFSHALANATISSQNVQNLLKSGDKFDIIIFDLFENQAFFGFGQHFNASTIVLSTGTSMFVNALAGNSAPYAFVPNKFTAYSDQMSFYEKLCNTLYSLYISIEENLLILPEQKILYDTYFHSPVVKFDDAIKKASLYLINSHVLLESPRPYLPNMIPIAGLHIKSNPLPKDLKDYLDNATEEVILFSLGSVLNPKNIPENKKNEILKTFAKLPQKILWKFDRENMFLDNVKIENWLPQNDILAHPNVKLFITHGGLLSCIETLYHGVPILGIPFFGDQFGNINRFVSLGYGKQLLFQELTEETFFNTIVELINNKSYFNNIKHGSNIFRDRPIHPLDEAIFWIEHIIKNKEGTHLQSRSIHLSWAQYLLLDVIFCFLLIMLCIYIFVILFCVFKRKGLK